MAGTTLVIPKADVMSEVYDFASCWGDREIVFPPGSRFAVVLAAYYGGKGYTTHRTAKAASDKSYKMWRFHHVIIDAEGRFYRRRPGGLTLL